MIALNLKNIEYRLCDEYQRFLYFWRKLPISNQIEIYNNLAIIQGYPIIYKNDKDTIDRVAKIENVDPYFIRVDSLSKWFVKDIEWNRYVGINDNEYDEDNIYIFIDITFKHLEEIFNQVDSWSSYIEYESVFKGDSNLELAYAKACFKYDLLRDLLPEYEDLKRYDVECFFIEYVYKDMDIDYVDIDTINAMIMYFKLSSKFRWANKKALEYYAFDSYKFKSSNYTFDYFGYFYANYKYLNRISKFNSFHKTDIIQYGNNFAL